MVKEVNEEKNNTSSTLVELLDDNEVLEPKSSDLQWNLQFLKCKEFYQKNGHLRVDVGTVEENDLSLSR